MNWPIGMGADFGGVCERNSVMLHLYASEGTHGESEARERSVPMDSPEGRAALTDRESSTLREEIELLDIGGEAFTREKTDPGQLTPMFLGTAVTYFSVRL